MKRSLSEIVAELEALPTAERKMVEWFKTEAAKATFKSHGPLIIPGDYAIFVANLFADLERLCQAVRCAENLSYVVFGASSNASVNDANKRSALAEWDKIAGGSDEI